MAGAERRLTALAFQALEPAVRYALHRLPPETAHRFAALLIRCAAELKPEIAAALGATFVGRPLAHPIGLAAGFDKSATMLHGLARLGFSAIEAGTVTPRPQPGNPWPRLFRLPEDAALINRFGFNNDGAEIFARRLAARPRGCVIGVNIGINKESREPLADFADCLGSTASGADYVTINVSSPNTPGLRDLQEPKTLCRLLEHLQGEHPQAPPLFLKLAPDLDEARLDDIVDVAIQTRIKGLILTNTTIERPPALQGRHRGEAGGLSGRPLRPKAQRLLRQAAPRAFGKLELVSAGGIEDGKDVYRRLRAGASFVQVYTAFIYHGPGLIERICLELADAMQADGLSRLDEVIGADLA